MWVYEKKLQYPVRVSKCDPNMAKFLIEQYGGADGELAAALRYMNQRYTVPGKIIGLLNDISTEELSHLEMIATMVYKLTKDCTPEQLKAAGLGEHYVNHDKALFYHNAAGVPWTAAYIQAKGDPFGLLDTTNNRRIAEMKFPSAWDFWFKGFSHRLMLPTIPLPVRS